jgi:hypothetical protein
MGGRYQTPSNAPGSAFPPVLGFSIPDFWRQTSPKRPSGRSLLGSPRLRNQAARGLLVREAAAKALSLHLKFPNAEFTPPARRH